MTESVWNTLSTIQTCSIKMIENHESDMKITNKMKLMNDKDF